VETGLSLLTNRYYDGGTGRFLTRDPIGYKGGLNLYGFTGNNPVNGSDPSGLDWLDDAANFSAGMGDVLSFGLTGRVRQGLGVDDVVNRHSGMYVGGEVTGVAVSFVDAGAGAVGAVRAVRAAGGVRSIVAGARAARAAAPAAQMATAAARVATNRANGIAAQNFLLGVVAGRPQVFFRTTLGARFVDVLDAANVAHESKVGYTSLSSSVSRQILKDAELLRTGQVQGVTWHFFRSPITNLRGATQPLLNELARHGIQVVFHS
jgi:hypothetical protein